MSISQLKEKSPFIGKNINVLSGSERYFSELQCSHKLSLPVTNITVLSMNKFAGIVQTNTKKGEACF